MAMVNVVWIGKEENRRKRTGPETVSWTPPGRLREMLVDRSLDYILPSILSLVFSQIGTQ